MAELIASVTQLQSLYYGDRNVPNLVSPTDIAYCCMARLVRDIFGVRLSPFINNRMALGNTRGLSVFTVVTEWILGMWIGAPSY